MKRLVALVISIGVLAGLYTFVAFSWTNLGSWTAPLSVWIGFAAWRCSTPRAAVRRASS